jgi:hypothetical protein
MLLRLVLPSGLGMLVWGRVFMSGGESECSEGGCEGQSSERSSSQSFMLIGANGWFLGGCSVVLIFVYSTQTLATRAIGANGQEIMSPLVRISILVYK